MNRIRELREARGWSQPYLGKLLDCSAMQVSRLERDDDKLYPSLIQKLARIFDVPPADVLGWDGAPPLDVELLAQAILAAEQWLERQGRQPGAATKARIVVALYEMALRDRDAGGKGRVEVEPLEPVLRLLLPA
jgi:transcriptional regulator with XRE-family HTH domain